MSEKASEGAAGAKKLPKKPLSKAAITGTPAKPSLKTLRQTHPAHELERDHRKAYLAEVVRMLSLALDDKVIRDAFYFLADELGASLDSSFWRQREVARNYRAAREGKLSEAAAAAAQSALSKFHVDQLGRKNDAETLSKSASARWTTYKRHKAFLFLDCARVLHAAGAVNCELQINHLAERLKIEPAAIATVKEFVAVGDTGAYRAVCQSLDQLVNKHGGSSKKSPGTKLPIKPKRSTAP